LGGPEVPHFLTSVLLLCSDAPVSGHMLHVVFRFSG